MTDLVPFVVKQLQDHSIEKIYDLLGDGTAYRRIYASVYHTLVSSKELTRIEDLPQEEKLQIWEIAKRITREDRITASKAIYLTQQLLKK